MLWIKAWHVIFMVTWFAGLFYLPRLFVYHASATNSAGMMHAKLASLAQLAIAKPF
jgi:putative membrane protein